MEFFYVIASRRSVRKFTDDEVPLEDIKKMIEAATLAPSAHNTKPWKFIIVKNKQKISEVVDSVHKWMDAVLESPALSDELKEHYDKFRPYFTFYKDAPVLIVACGVPYESVPGKAVSAAFPEKYRESKVNSLEQSVSAAIENLILAATALGYGTCWATGPLLAADDMKKILNIPDDWIIFALIPVGKPLKEPRPKRPQDFDEVAVVIE